jgi:hypothetical protein
MLGSGGQTRAVSGGAAYRPHSFTAALGLLHHRQYQRTTHYGIAGFGTAAAYAKALGLKDDNKKLREATKEIMAETSL